MKVSGFMVPAEKVVSVTPKDTVRHVMDLMLGNKIGAVVVQEKEVKITLDDEKDGENKLPIPIGIITKSDIMKGYQNRVGIEDPCEAIMYKGELATCSQNSSRDYAAKILEQNHFHHLVVVDDKHEQFLGLLSSWDITAECAKDHRAWPWNRSEDGRFHRPMEKKEEKKDDRPSSPKQAEDHPTILKHDHGHDEFATYMDDLDLAGFQ